MNLMRNADTVREDMLEWVKMNIYARIGQEWDYHGKDFDPLIHLLVGACASELKQVYEAIQESDRRVLRQMAEMLLPEARHLPAPAYALATAAPTGSTYILAEKLQFRCDAAGETAWFSPVFEQNLLQATLKVIGSNAGVFKYPEHKPGESPAAQERPSVMTNRLLLGFDCPKLPDSLSGVSFYFDLKGANRNPVFLDAIANGRWSIQKQDVKKVRGWDTEDLPEDALDTSRALKHRIQRIYQKHFFTITDDRKTNTSETPVPTVLTEWLEVNGLKNAETEAQTQKLGALTGKFLWIEIDLAYPVRVQGFEQFFQCSTCVFPVVNRQLHVKDDADTYFDRPALNVIHIHSDYPFAGVRRVFNQQTGDEFQYFPIAYFKESEKAAFSVRYGGVGRLDNYNIWQRFVYILNTLREENRLREVVEKIGDKVSVEDLHLILGERISKDDFKEARSAARDLYVFLHPGLTAKGVRAIAEYWTTIGDKANGLPAGQPLTAAPSIPGLKKEDKSEICVRLIEKSSGGKNVASEPELFQSLKDILIRRERLLTLDDIKSYCRTQLGDALESVSIEQSVELDPRPGFGLTRIFKVVLTPKDSENPSWPDLCREIEMALAEQAVSAIPYRVSGPQ